jgi:uncharacterized protein (TIGR02118 family)
VTAGDAGDPVTDAGVVQKVVAAVHGPVGDAPPPVDGLLAGAVLRPHPGEDSPHPPSVHAIVMVWLAGDATPRPTRWYDSPVDAYLVDERVQIAGPSEWNDGPPAAAIVQCSFVRRRPELTRAQFAAHWSDVHAPLVPVHHPGVARYVQHVVVAPLTPDAPEVDGIAQLTFATPHDFHERYYDSESGRRLVGADVAQFIDRPAGWRMTAREVRLPPVD